MDERRIILLAKTGSGRSSLGNTIFGEKIFEAKSSSISVTHDFKPHRKEINGKSICLIDTPGVFDTDPNCTDVTEKFYNCVQDCAPGPHAFLLVLKVERHTQQEQDAVKEILKYFSEEALKYTTVVFTHGDQLEEGQRIEDWYKENEALRSLVQKCGGRCHVFDNKHWNNSQDSYRNNQVQVTELLKTIEETVEKNGGGFYTNGFWKRIKHMKVKGVPLKYLLAALFGAAAVGGASAFSVAKLLFDATTATAVATGVVGGAGVAYALAPDEVGALASSAVGKVGAVGSSAVDKVGALTSDAERVASAAVKSMTSCTITGNKSKTS